MRSFDKNVAAGILVSDDEKILMGRKGPNSTGVYIGYWILPGGVVDEGETALDTLRREVKDETGVDLSRYEPRLVDDTGQDEAQLTLSTGEEILYRMRFSAFQVDMGRVATEIPVTPGDELVDLQWAPKGELPNYNLCPPSIDLFQKLGYLSTR